MRIRDRIALCIKEHVSFETMIDILKLNQKLLEDFGWREMTLSLDTQEVEFDCTAARIYVNGFREERADECARRERKLAEKQVADRLYKCRVVVTAIRSGFIKDPVVLVMTCPKCGHVTTRSFYNDDTFEAKSEYYCNECTLGSVIIPDLQLSNGESLVDKVKVPEDFERVCIL